MCRAGCIPDRHVRQLGGRGAAVCRHHVLCLGQEPVANPGEAARAMIGDWNTEMDYRDGFMRRTLSAIAGC